MSASIKTPLIVQKIFTGTYEIHDASGNVVATVGHEDKDKARAEQLATIINAHDDLVRALKKCAAVCAGITLNKSALIQALEASATALEKAGVKP